MKRLIVAVLMCAVSVGWAREIVPATKPATRPATRPVAVTTQPAGTLVKLLAATTRPAMPVKVDAPVAKPAPVAVNVDDKMPSAAELMEKIKAKQASFDKLLRVAHVNLDSPVMEKSPDFTIFGDEHLLTVHRLLERLHKARDDKGVRAVLITMSANTGFNLAQAQEIKSALTELRKAGKRTFVYADGYDTAAYIAATGATDICLLAGGEIMIPGVSIETMYVRGLLDKVGVKADYVQIGEYKGADEMYTRTEASPESKGELNKVVEGLYEVMVDTISINRNISKQAVKQMIDDCILSAKQAKDRKLVDHLLSQDDLRDLMKTELGGDINLMPNYAIPQRERMDFSNPLALLAQMGKKQTETEKPAIALIHAEGVIVDGEAEDGLMGASGNVGSENIRKSFRAAVRDENVLAIVLRIDSPGGSALASEVMWQAVQAAAKDKPVIVSIGSMAASGGYYLASAGDYIFADPSAIIGSIGVVGGKFVLHDVFEKFGVATETFSRGKNAGLFSMNTEWNDRQRRMVSNWMKQTYEQFTERVMVMRKGKIKNIDDVARGRIFVAKQARELGMVDELGGLTQAIAFAANEVDLKAGEFEIKAIPGSHSLLDVLMGNVDPAVEARMPYKPRIEIKISADSPLLALPAGLRKMIGQQIQMMQLLEKRPVMLVSPYIINVK